MAKPDNSKKTELARSPNHTVADASSRSKVFGSFLDQQRPLKAFISRFVRRPQDVDDIAQETFVRAFLAEQKGDIQHKLYRGFLRPIPLRVR